MNSSQQRTLAIVNCALIVFVLLFSLQGCSAVFWSSETPQEKPEVKSETEAKPGKATPPSVAKPPAESASVKPQNTSGSMEIMWQVPTEPVEAYHIYLLSGPMDQKDESKHFRVPVSTLKKFDHATFGPVYKYTLPANVQTHSIQIRAENRFGLSEPSEPQIVEK